MARPTWPSSAGVYATAESTGYGNPPQLLLSRPDVTHELSSALADAVAAHRHSLGTDLPGEPFTGRHVQVLINQGGMEFEDETVSWMGDQSATHIQVRLAGGPQMVKFDRDECADQSGELFTFLSRHLRGGRVGVSPVRLHHD